MSSTNENDVPPGIVIVTEDDKSTLGLYNFVYSEEGLHVYVGENALQGLGNINLIASELGITPISKRPVERDPETQQVRPAVAFAGKIAALQGTRIALHNDGEFPSGMVTAETHPQLFADKIVQELVANNPNSSLRGSILVTRYALATFGRENVGVAMLSGAEHVDPSQYLTAEEAQIVPFAQNKKPTDLDDQINAIKGVAGIDQITPLDAQ